MPDGGAERPWRGRRVRRLPLPRPACGLAAAKNARGGERRRCDRRVASGLCRCDADVRRDRRAARQEGPAVTRLTMAQALVRFLASQYVERDGVEQRFFAGVWGIFGHGNVAGIGEALYERPDLLPYHMARNEQSMVHTACGYARMKDRLATFACTSSIGPGATNMLTGAALATVNRLPVLLLPGDVFASRIPDPVLQQVEVPARGDVSVNDAFQPLSRYWDRIARPEQLIPAALAAMRVLTSPADTGAATLALPQDVQAEAYDYPEEFLGKRVWHVDRRPPAPSAIARALDLLARAKRPLVVAGGGVIYSCASAALRAFVDATGIPVAETQAGKGSLPYDHPSALGAIGATGTSAANRIAAGADVVIGIGTRWSDFTTASKSAFEDPGVRFVNVNVAEIDAAKHAGVMVLADAREALEALSRSSSSSCSTTTDSPRSAASRVRWGWMASALSSGSRRRARAAPIRRGSRRRTCRRISPRTRRASARR